MLLTVVAAAAVLAGLASALPAHSSPLGRKFAKLAKGLQLCNEQTKSAKQLPSVCSYTTGDLHFICDSFTYQEAWQVCAANGQRLAVVDSASSESFAAFDITDACMATGTTGAWLAAYNGMAGLPCMYMQPDGTIIQSNGENCDLRLPVICQDLPAVTLTTPSAFNPSTLEVTVTNYQQVCPSSPCSGVINCRGRKCSPCPGGRPYTDALGNVDLWPRCCDHQGCDPLCPVGLNDLYIINSGPKGIPFSLADRECQKYGLHLADLTSALLPSFANLTRQCAADEVKFWIRSFNGVGGNEQCVWAEGGQSKEVVEYYPIGYGIIDGACFGLTVQRILCQDRPAAQLGLGPFVGPVTTTTTTFIGEQYAFTSTSTVLTTVTFYP